MVGRSVSASPECGEICDRQRASRAHSGGVGARKSWHLTLCGVPGDLAVLAAAAAYVRECGLLPLKPRPNQ